MIYVILGMHKSGTTLISQILHKSGINMGDFDETVGYDQGNQYERKAAQMINLRILGCGNAHSLDVTTPIQKISSSSDIGSLIQKLVTDLNKKNKHWGFKDPRTCLTYPVWEKFLPAHKVIYVYRDPLEIWHHYRKYIPKRKFIQRSIQGYKALKAWYIYNDLVLKCLRTKKKPYHVINFKNFMESTEEFNQLFLFIDGSLQDCRKKEMYRSKPKQEKMFRLCSTLLSRQFSYGLKELTLKIARCQNGIEK